MTEDIKVVTIYDQIDGRRPLYMGDLVNRLRAEAMKAARAKYPNEPERCKNLVEELYTHGSIERIKDKNVFKLTMMDMNERVWARYQVEVLDA